MAVRLLREAEAYLRCHRIPEAIKRLHQALHQLLHAHTPIPHLEIRCLLLLAQAHHLQEDLTTARLYTDEAAARLRSASLSKAARAEITLALARLAPDVGRLSMGLIWAEQAGHLFEAVRDPLQLFEAAHLAAGLASQLGRFPEARAHLARAALLLQGLPSEERPRAQVLLHSAQAHHAWYQGHLAQALTHGTRAQRLADACNLGKERLCTRLLRANLLRDLGRPREAAPIYTELEKLLETTGFPGFRTWIWAHRAWLEAREGHFDSARERLFQALDSADPGQAASLQVFLAATYALTGRDEDALELLRASLHFYQRSGDALATFALHIHLAAAHLHLGRPTQAEEHLAVALDWAIRHNADYFPHWWHPDLVAPTLVHALVAGIHPTMAERILVRRLPEAALPLLRPLLEHPEPVVARRLQDTWNLILPARRIFRDDGMEPQIRQTLEELVHDRVLRLECLPELSSFLAEEDTGDRPANPALLATFGLYVQGLDRQTIAARVGRSEATVRNYITRIYERFGLTGWRGSRRDRRAQLRRKAREKGFIGPA